MSDIYFHTFDKHDDSEFGEASFEAWYDTDFAIGESVDSTVTFPCGSVFPGTMKCSGKRVSRLFRWWKPWTWHKRKEWDVTYSFDYQPRSELGEVK